MFCDHPDLKKLCIYTYIYIYIYTKLTYFNYPNKNVEYLYMRIIRI